MVANGVPTTIVEKLLDNLRELTRNVSEVNLKQDSLQDACDESSEKIAAILTKIAERLNTPPRHEELEKQISDLDKKLDDYKKAEEDQTDLLKNVIRTIKIAAGLFGLAILIAAIVVTVIEKTKYTGDRDINQDKKIESVEKQLQEHMQKPQK